MQDTAGELSDLAVADLTAADRVAAENALANTVAADKAVAKAAAKKPAAAAAAADKGSRRKPATEKPPYKVSYGLLPKGKEIYDKGKLIGREKVMCDLRDTKHDCPPLKTDVHELIAERAKRLRTNIDELVADAHAANVPYHAAFVELRRAPREGGRRVGIDVFSSVSRSLDEDERCSGAASALAGVMLSTVQGNFFLKQAQQARSASCFMLL